VIDGFRVFDPYMNKRRAFNQFEQRSRKQVCSFLFIMIQSAMEDL